MNFPTNYKGQNSDFTLSGSLTLYNVLAMQKVTGKSGKGMQTSATSKDYKHRMPKSVIRYKALKALLMLLTLRLLRSFCKGTTL